MSMFKCPVEGKAMKEETRIAEGSSASSERFTEKPRLNLNDLLERRNIQKRMDKKANLIILSGVAAISVAILLILSF